GRDGCDAPTGGVGRPAPRLGRPRRAERSGAARRDDVRVRGRRAAVADDGAGRPRRSPDRRPRCPPGRLHRADDQEVPLAGAVGDLGGHRGRLAGVRGHPLGGIQLARAETAPLRIL
ncbi:MAG: hypothetical protein AVDCRST_MAG18-1400, partial [uncultured Thermomicrobiales bacterium]